MINLKEAMIKAMIVLGPTYTIALLTEKMVYVVPMLAATSFFSGSISITNRVDEDDEEGSDSND